MSRRWAFYIMGEPRKWTLNTLIFIFCSCCAIYLEILGSLCSRWKLKPLASLQGALQSKPAWPNHVVFLNIHMAGRRRVIILELFILLVDITHIQDA